MLRDFILFSNISLPLYITNLNAIVKSITGKQLKNTIRKVEKK